MRLLSFRGPVLFLTLTLLFANLAFTDYWYEHYARGEKALEERKWDEAIRQFSQAVDKDPGPDNRKRTYGMNFVNYHPYLKLGIAYYNMGNFDRALEAFDTEEKMGGSGRGRRGATEGLSGGDLQNLQTFRRLAQGAKQAASGNEQERLAKVVADSLAESRNLEGSGKLDEAVVALGKGLAIDPKNAEAQKEMQRLRDLLAQQEKQRGIDTRFAKLVSEGKDLFAAGKYEEASSQLSQALSLKNTPEAKALFDESQTKIRESIKATQNAEAQRALIKDGLVEVGRMEAAGKLSDALQKLQSILALDPKNPDALGLQNRLAKAQADSDLQQEVSKLLDEGGGLLKGGEYEKSVASFNRVLALDPTNSIARSYVAQAWKAIGQSILNEGVAPRATKLPPTILLAHISTIRPANEPETELGLVRSPVFIISGWVLDDKPGVTISYYASKVGLLETDQGEPDRVYLIKEQPTVGTDTGRGSAIHVERNLGGEPMGAAYKFYLDYPVELDPGEVASLKVVVSDSDGLATEASHIVGYIQLWWRTPWFYSLLGLLGVSTLGVYQGFRVYRRNRLLKRRFNPYVAGAPVLKDDLFMGREVLLSRILQTIHNNSILLYGERRIGKTSLQHHLKKRLEQVRDPDYDFYPVFIDLQGTPQERFFATLAEDVFQELSSVLDGGRSGRGLSEGVAYTYNEFIRDISNVLKALRKRSGKKIKLVLLIDEVDELNNYDPRINQKLRSLFMKSFAEDMVAVVSGVGIKKHWASEGSPWYNFFEEIEVKPFTRKDAEELVERPIRGIFKLGKGAVDRIIEKTDCKPYLIQKLCVALVNRLHDEKRREITVADVEAIGRPAEG